MTRSSSQVRIYLAGDSTVQTYKAEHAPQAGWGQYIDRYFTNDVQFHNHAIGGRSSKTFITEQRLDAIIEQIRSGDYLFVQMGHNDSSVSRPERYTDPWTTYKTYLRMYVQAARDHHALPIFITPVGRLHYRDGEFLNDFTAYCQAMQEVATELDVLLIDLMTRSLEYYTSIGYDEVHSLFMISVNGTDCTHFTEKGAASIAKLVAQGVKDLALNISSFVRV